MTERYSGADSDAALTGPVLRQIGYHLRLAREERGETLQELAQFLRIRRPYLQNLEDGDLAKIPGRAYALGFLRSYGDYLGFDGEAIVNEVKRTDEPLPESPTLQVREPLPESHRPPLMLVGVSLLLSAIIYVGWSYWQDQRERPLSATLGFEDEAPPGASDDDPDVTQPDEAAALSSSTELTASVAPGEGVEAPVAKARERWVPDAAGDTTSGRTPALAADEELAPLPPVPEPPMPESVDALATATPFDGAVSDEADAESGDAAVDAILADDEPAAAPITADADADEPAPDEPTSEEPADLLAVISAQSGGAEPRMFGADDGGGRVVLVASQPSWVQVRSPSRDYVWTRTLEPGDAYFVPDRADLALWTGNAGGLRVLVDGRPLAELGRTGQVRRDIPLAAEALSEQYGAN